MDQSQNFTTLNNLENSDFLNNDKTLKNINNLIISNINNNSNTNINLNQINNNPNINPIFNNVNNNSNALTGKNSKSHLLNLNLNSNSNLNNLNVNNTTHSLLRNNNNSNRIFANTNNNHFCPYCSHCSSIGDPNMENLIANIREAKNIITNSFEFILQNNIIDSNNMSIFHPNNSNKDDKDLMQDIEVLLGHNKKQVTHKNGNNRLVYKVVAHFLDGLLSEKVSLEAIVNNSDLVEKFERIVSAKGMYFERSEEKGLFDEELEEMFDVKTKEKIKNLLRSICFILFLFFFFY